MFLPGSQISDKPLKDISHLMNEPQKFMLIKLIKCGRAPALTAGGCSPIWKCMCIKREIISSFKRG